MRPATLSAILLAFAACSPLSRTAPAELPAPVVMVPTAIFEHPTAPPRTGTLPTRTHLTSAHLMPGATLPARGGIRALVFPLTVGPELPTWSDSLVAVDLFGHAEGGPDGAAAILAAESGNLFRLHASVFPVLAAPQADAVLFEGPTAYADRLVRRAIRRWAYHADLAGFDNDGPDGVPSSVDDDGVVDLVVVPVETDSSRFTYRLPLSMEVESARGRSMDLREAIVIGVPRGGTLRGEAPALVRTLVDAMGVPAAEAPSPAGHSHALSAIARVRLGWADSHYVTQSGEYALPAGHVLVVPVVDVDNIRGLWLVERDGDRLWLTRVARLTPHHFGLVDRLAIRAGADPVTIPLTQAGGSAGPHMKIDHRSGALRVHVRFATGR